MVLTTNNKENKASRKTNGLKRELASGKISELTKWSGNTPGDTQSVKTWSTLFFFRCDTQSVEFGQIRCSI